jgi:biotin-[acetyl-CoA-carboxylase] ligase BirA-like protein
MAAASRTFLMSAHTGDPRSEESPIAAILLDTVDSTNDEAKRRLHAGQLRVTSYILAREQTAGKGSRGRRWASPRGAGIYLSVIERGREGPLPTTTAYTVAAGVACAEALWECLGVEVQLKPVNDLYVDGRKLGGILTESFVQQAGTQALITGVGINVRRADRPVTDGAASPIALQDLLPPHRFAEVDQSTLVSALVSGVHRWNGTVAAGDVEALRQGWLRFRMPGSDWPIERPGDGAAGTGKQDEPPRRRGP